MRKRDVPARKIQELKLAFSEFYLSLILLQNYQNLNFTGFRKILKKHDKVCLKQQGINLNLLCTQGNGTYYCLSKISFQINKIDFFPH